MRHALEGLGAVWLCWMLVGVAVARADAIDGPPACPPGTEGRSAHEGQWCEASPCTAGGDCRDGATCRPWRVCTQRSLVQRGGLHGEDHPPVSRELAVAGCAVESACDGASEPPPPTVGRLEGVPVCTDGHYCVPSALPPLPSLAPPTTSSASSDPSLPVVALGHGCGCRAHARSRPDTSLVLAVLGLGLASRRTRRSRARALAGGAP
ncbi:MAG: hypothetical protein K1X94_30585 [Sandaracinaceae bacterium]|nr:hypothetical protein [Sandaracinaceae bacterium]